MSLSSEYRSQRAWRPWAKIFSELPVLAGSTILDLGCGPGDQAAELAAGGAQDQVRASVRQRPRS